MFKRKFDSKSKEEKKEEMNKILKELEEGIKNVFTSERYKDFLKFTSKFHNYSINNIVWLQSQKPTISYVAGLKTWNTLGRKVNKGEKSLKVLAPMKHSKVLDMEKIDTKTGKPLKDSKGNIITEKQKVEWISYRAVPVFDISQTNGKEIPRLIDELNGTLGNKKILLESLKNISKVPIDFKEIPGEAKGYFDTKANCIAIQKDMSEIQTLKTMVHELTHSRLHNLNEKDIKNKSRETKELEAESVAYVVLNHFDIDTSDYSFGYLASWSKDKELNDFKASLNVIQKESNELINELENELKLVLDKDKELQENKETSKHNDNEKIQQFENGELDNNNNFKEPYIVVEWSEGDKFKAGEVMSFKEANEKFKNEESKVRELKEEYEKKGEYYPYFKTKFDLHYAPNNKITMRYDIGDSYAKDLSDFCNKEIGRSYKDIVKNINSLNEKQVNNIKNEKVSVRDKLKSIKESKKNNVKENDKKELSKEGR